MNLSEAVLRATVAKLLMEELTAADKDTRSHGMELFLAVHKSMGLKSAEVRLPDGTHIATATLPQPKERIDIDEAAFLKVVEEDRPDEIVKLVNPAYVTAVRRNLKAMDGVVVDVRTGEVVEWASVRPAGSPRNFTITFTATGRDLIKEAWRDDPAQILDVLAPAALPPAAEDVAESDEEIDLSTYLEQRARQRGEAGDAA